jgi:hypothetical protein
VSCLCRDRQNLFLKQLKNAIFGFLIKGLQTLTQTREPRTISASKKYRVNPPVGYKITDLIC